MNLKITSSLGIAIVVVAFIVGFSLMVIATEKSEDDLDRIFSRILSYLNISRDTSLVDVEDIVQFTSEEDFKAYLAEAATDDYFGYGAIGGARSMAMDNIAWESTGDVMMAVPKSAGAEPERVSGTNVQVLGIDEPDIVKTDGKNIYFSPGHNWGYRDIYWYGSSRPESKIKIVNAFPPADLASISEIDGAGDLFLAEDILVVFSGQNIYGYDVSDPKDSEKKWTVKLENNNSLVEARLYNNKIYLVTKQRIDIYHPCPIKPLTVGDVAVNISCGEIYHPVDPVPTDVTFTAMVLNSNSGKVEQKTSFVGSSGSSLVYMSEQGIYVTYSYSNSVISFFAGFLKEAAADLFPQHIIDKMEKLESYDISEAAKMTEFGIIMERYQNSLDNDERMKIENEMENRMRDYYKKHRRELERTGIVKMGLKDLTIQASGSVPGNPLNQFALDEYNNDLRIATTIGENWNIFSSGSSDSANDVYVLNSDLELQGYVHDLGLGERIYSVRFLGEMGYVVTYRQIDPFYVLDLSDPKNPEVKGELKIPGYSSYLHPLAKDRILGIGKEGWKVKLSLFDVSDPSDPKEIDKYNLDESYSDVLSTHHAFLQDSKHNIFFMPGGKGGYIFSYQNDKLSLTKAISQSGVRRAVYINDYLYIISDSKISILNEKDWERINELDI